MLWEGDRVVDTDSIALRDIDTLVKYEALMLRDKDTIVVAE